MKRIKYVLLLIFVLIVIGIGIKTLIPKEKNSISQGIISKKDTVPDKQESLSNEPSQRNLGKQEAVKPIESSKTILNFNISQLSMSEWNTPSGIPYVQVPGANLGATSFVIIDKNRIAFLCNSTGEIIITNKSTGRSIKKFQVSIAPRDFVYENGIFYILSEYEVTLYDDNGNELKKYPFHISYQGVERLIRYNDATYLILPSGNSLMIENSGTPIKPFEYKGIMTRNGQFISSILAGNNSYSIKISISNENAQEKTFTTDKKIAGVFVVGATENRVILDVQTFISENPIAIERTIISIERNKNGIGAIISGAKIPDCNYVNSNKDFYVSEKGNIFNMVTSPQGVFVFSLTETKSGKSQGYPSSLIDTQYHSNDHLIKID